MASSPALTFETRKILQVLLGSPSAEHYGLELAEAAGLPSGSIYPILARLERAGWVESDWEELEPEARKRHPRRYYKLTALGARVARDSAAEILLFFSPAPMET